MEAFEAVARHGSVQAASREIGLTQTGVTQRLRALEGRVEATLFVRSRRGMQLTAEGQSLLRYCQAARDLEGATLAAIQKGGSSHEVTLCVSGPSSVLRSRIIPAASRPLSKFPRLLLRFDLADIESAAGKLRSGFAQIVVLPRSEVALEMDSKRLRPERYILVGPSGWKKRSIEEIVETETIIDFDPSDQMTFQYLSKAKLLKRHNGRRHFVNNTDALASMIAEGHGYSVLSDELARPLIRAGQLADLKPGTRFDYEIALAWYPRPHMPAYFRAFVDAIR